MLRFIKKTFVLIVVVLAITTINNNTLASTISNNRLAGEDRYSTSVEISKNGWPDGSVNVILASGIDFPDALCAAPLSKLLNAPILLTGQYTLPSSISQEITRLKPTNVYIIGGSGIISDNISKSMNSLGVNNVIRIGGTDRYETSVKVAAQVDKLSGGFSSIAVASGLNFPDALSIAPIAANKGMPIILTRNDALPTLVKNYLGQKHTASAYIIGASGVISEGIKTSLTNYSNAVERIAGNDRYDTNAAVLNKFSGELDFSTLYAADGLKFPDALACSALAAKNEKASPLLLSRYGDISSKIYTLINDNYTLINTITAVGGPQIVPDSIFTINQISLKKNKIIVVDAGHGGYQPGAVGNNLVEDELNLDIALKTRDILKNQGYTVYMTRESDTYVSLYDRANMANELGANLFLSIHHNSAESSSANGTTVLYNSQATAPAMELATMIRDEIVDALGTKKLPIQDRPGLVVLNQTTCEAVLAEVLFISNISDAQIISQDSNRLKAAEATVRAINKYYGFNN